MAGINEKLINENALYYEDETVPQNTTISSSAIKTGEGGQLGATRIIFRANTEIAIADTKTLTVVVQESADGSTGWTTIRSIPLLSSGATTYEAGLELAQYNLDETVLEYTRVQITTDDATATGSIDAFCGTPRGIGRY